MIDDISFSYSDFIILVVYLVFRLEIPRMSCMSTPLFDFELIGLEVTDLAQRSLGVTANLTRTIECR